MDWKFNVLCVCEGTLKTTYGRLNENEETHFLFRQHGFVQKVCKGPGRVTVSPFLVDLILYIYFQN